MVWIRYVTDGVTCFFWGGGNTGSIQKEIAGGLIFMLFVCKIIDNFHSKVSKRQFKFPRSFFMSYTRRWRKFSTGRDTRGRVPAQIRPRNFCVQSMQAV